MTEAQRLVLISNAQDLTVLVRGIEYPSHPQIEGGSNACMKLTCAVVDNNGVVRTWVDWYDEDGRAVSSRECVGCYDERSDEAQRLKEAHNRLAERLA